MRKKYDNVQDIVFWDNSLESYIWIVWIQFFLWLSHTHTNTMFTQLLTFCDKHFIIDLLLLLLLLWIVVVFVSARINDDDDDFDDVVDVDDDDGRSCCDFDRIIIVSSSILLLFVIIVGLGECFGCFIQLLLLWLWLCLRFSWPGILVFGDDDDDDDITTDTAEDGNGVGDDDDVEPPLLALVVDGLRPNLNLLILNVQNSNIWSIFCINNIDDDDDDQ